MTPVEAIAHLKACNLTEKDIGAAVGVFQGTINKICKSGMKPNWELGQSLVRLAEATPLPPANDDLQSAA